MINKPFRLLLSILFLNLIVIEAAPLSDIANEKNTPDEIRIRCLKQADELSTYSIDSAMVVLQAGIQYFRLRNYTPALAELLYKLATMHNSNGSLEQAQLAAEESMRLYSMLSDSKGIASVSNTLGVIHARKTDYSLATKLFLKALGIFTSATPPDTQGIISCYIKLGLVNDYTGNRVQSSKYYTKGLELALKKRDTTNIIHLYNNLGVLYGKNSDTRRALLCFNQSLEWVKNREVEQIAPLLNMGNIYSAAHTPESDAKSLDYFRKALTIAQKYSRYEDMIRLKINIAGIEYEQKPAEAIQILERIQIELIARQMPQLRMDALNQLIDIHEQKSNFKEALRYWKIKTSLNDSLSGIQQVKEVADLQSVYELELSQKKLNQLQETNDRNTTQRNLILLFTAAITLVMVALTYLYKKRLELNKLLRKREEELTLTGEMKDRIFAIIGHDLKNAIGNVPALIEIYKEHSTTPKEKEFILENLQLNATATFETLNNMLEWGKSLIKGVDVHARVFKASESVRDAVKLFTIALQQKHIHFIDSMPCDLYLFTDESHFNFIVRNLLSNAIKFTEKSGRIEVGILESNCTDEIILFVQDNGVGVSEHHMAQLFSKTAVSTQGTSQESGNGLGLMLCREFVEKSNGRIWAKGAPGQGTTFFVTFKKAPHHQQPS